MYYDATTMKGIAFPRLSSDGLVAMKTIRLKQLCHDRCQLIWAAAQEGVAFPSLAALCVTLSAYAGLVTEFLRPLQGVLTLTEFFNSL